jgi:uncharacterized protein YraI
MQRRFRIGRPRTAWRSLLAGIGSLGLIAASGVPAELSVDLPPGTSQAEMPLGGSWRQSCADARLDSDPQRLIFRLLASCRRIDGTMNETKANPASCGQPAAFGNQDGVLVCESGPRNKNLFPGSDLSWINDCIDDSMIGTTLSALCPEGGGAVRSSLDITTCAPPLRVDFEGGRLFCASGARIPPIGGSWVRSCVNESMSGTTLSTMCQTLSGTWVAASLDIATCNAPAAAGNEGGILVCESGTKPPAVAENSPAQPQTPPITTLRPAETAPVIIAQPEAPPPVVVAPQLAPVIAPTPVPAAIPAAPSTTFGDIWTVVTERGDTFSLDMKQTGKGVTGSVTLGSAVLQLNGSVISEDKASLVWQVGDLAGTGELTLASNKQDLKGKLILGDGQALQGGTWTATRKGSGSALPFGEIKGGPALPQAVTATAAPAAGYERAVSTTDLAIRDKPTSKGSKILGSLKTGEVVSVRCPPDNKYWCQLQDGRGWVSRQYINVGATATATPVTTTTTKKAATTTPSTKKSTTAKTTTKTQTVKKQETKKEDGNRNFLQGLGLGVGLGVILGNQ